MRYTEKQKQLAIAVLEYYESNYSYPTNKELGEILGIATGSVWDLLRRMEAGGVISQRKGKIIACKDISKGDATLYKRKSQEIITIKDNWLTKKLVS